VGVSWPIFVSQCKSGLSAVARSCFLGRRTARERCRQLTEQRNEARELAARRGAENIRLRENEQRLQRRIVELIAELAQPRPVTLPLGEVPSGMHYGAGLMELCVNLARELGLRPTIRALEIVFKWLGVEVAIPVYQAIRTWLQRLGLSRSLRAEHADGGVWLVDHTHQIGREKALTVLRVPDQRSHDAGPLRQEELEVLTVLPGESWKREDVLEVYRALAERYGAPRAIVSDGAAELQEPIAKLGEIPLKTVGKTAKPPLALRDPKHFLANRLEALLTSDPAWREFTLHIGSTRCAVQQTELAHFTPPAFKTKARFMNLAATLRWAKAVLWHGEHPDSQSRRGVTVRRMEEKLGWLRRFAPHLREWQACQDVIDAALALLNERGIFRGATDQLRKRVAKFATHPLSQKILKALLQFVQAYEHRLSARERLPLSTEILESCFAKYKQLEQQHSKGGFTSLLLAFPALLRPTTAAEITAAMQCVKTKDIIAWQQRHLPATLTSRRQILYREANPKPRTTPQRNVNQR
jgi:hypothetical protein